MYCPKCGGKIVEYEKMFACEDRKTALNSYGQWVNKGNCDFFIYKTVKLKNVDLYITRENLKSILRFDIAKVEAYSKQKNKKYVQKVILNDEKYTLDLVY